MSANTLQDRLPPQNPDAERSVLGSMMRDNGVIGDVLQIVKEDNFYHPAHRKIYQAVVALYDRGDPVDLVTVGNLLHELKQVEEISGYEYLARIYDDTPTAANAEYYAKIVRDKAIVRNLIHSSNEVLREAYNQNAPAEELLEAAERRIMEIAEWGVTGQTYTVEQAIHEAFDRIDTRHQRDHWTISGLPTGFVDLDDKTAGLQDSELIIVAARPSVGKTAFALNLVRHVAVDEGHPVFFVSLEQSRIEIAERLLCGQSRVDSFKLRKGHLSTDDHQKLIAASGDLREAKIFIDDSPGQNMLRIAANARRLKLRHKIRAVFVDYLQLVEPDNRRDSRQEQVAGISRRLKFLAKELRIPVVACAQLNRSVENRTDNTPRLADLRESGSIEQDADTVMMLHRPEMYTRSEDGGPSQDEGRVEIHIAKQRNGPTGEINLTYIKQFMRFENFAVDAGFGIGP